MLWECNVAINLIQQPVPHHIVIDCAVIQLGNRLLVGIRRSKVIANQMSEPDAALCNGAGIAFRKGPNEFGIEFFEVCVVIHDVEDIVEVIDQGHFSVFIIEQSRPIHAEHRVVLVVGAEMMVLGQHDNNALDDCFMVISGGNLFSVYKQRGVSCARLDP